MRNPSQTSRPLALAEKWRPAGYVGSTWPNVPISFAQYDVQLSPPSLGMESDGKYIAPYVTFASYQAADVTTVRSGSLSIAAGAFSADGGTTGVHGFGPIIDFTTPYPYTPGTDLVLMLRLTGYTGGAPQAFFATRTGETNVADAIVNTSSAVAASPNTTGAASPAYIQFIYEIPEPALGGATVMLGLLILVRRRGGRRTV